MDVRIEIGKGFQKEIAKIKKDSLHTPVLEQGWILESVGSNHVILRVAKEVRDLIE